MRRSISGGMQSLGKVAQESGIDGIALGEPSAGAGELPDPGWIEHTEGDPSRMSGSDQEAFVTAGSLEDEVSTSRQGFEQGGDAGLGIGQTPRSGSVSQIELSFAHIDPNIGTTDHRTLACHASNRDRELANSGGAGLWATVRVR